MNSYPINFQITSLDAECLSMVSLNSEKKVFNFFFINLRYLYMCFKFCRRHCTIPVGIPIK